MIFTLSDFTKDIEAAAADAPVPIKAFVQWTFLPNLAGRYSRSAPILVAQVDEISGPTNYVTHCRSIAMVQKTKRGFRGDGYILLHRADNQFQFLYGSRLVMADNRALPDTEQAWRLWSQERFNRELPQTLGLSTSYSVSGYTLEHAQTDVHRMATKYATFITRRLMAAMRTTGSRELMALSRRPRWNPDLGYDNQKHDWQRRLRKALTERIYARIITAHEELLAYADGKLLQRVNKKMHPLMIYNVAAAGMTDEARTRRLDFVEGPQVKYINIAVLDDTAQFILKNIEDGLDDAAAVAKALKVDSGTVQRMTEARLPPLFRSFLKNVNTEPTHGLRLVTQRINGIAPENWPGSPPEWQAFFRVQEYLEQNTAYLPVPPQQALHTLATRLTPARHMHCHALENVLLNIKTKQKRSEITRKDAKGVERNVGFRLKGDYWTTTFDTNGTLQHHEVQPSALELTLHTAYKTMATMTADSRRAHFSSLFPAAPKLPEPRKRDKLPKLKT